MLRVLPFLVHRSSATPPSRSHPSKTNLESSGQRLVPLQKSDKKRRLLPFTKRLWVMQHHSDLWFLPTIFDDRDLVHFSALTNVQELGIDQCGPTPDPAAVPHSAPSLRGRLTLRWYSGEAFLRYLSESSGGLRFRYMDPIEVSCVRLILDACPETLQTLRVHPARWIPSKGYSRGFCLSDPPVCRSSRNCTARLRPIEKQVASSSRDCREGNTAMPGRSCSRVSQGHWCLPSRRPCSPTSSSYSRTRPPAMRISSSVLHSA